MHSKRNLFQARGLTHSSTPDWGTILSILVILGALSAHLAAPRFGMIHHQHDGGERLHFHPEWQSVSPSGPGHSSDHLPDQSPIPDRLARIDSEPGPILLQADRLKWGHTHRYDQIGGKFFVEAIPRIHSLPFQATETVIHQTRFLYQGANFNPRAPPQRISSIPRIERIIL